MSVFAAHCNFPQAEILLRGKIFQENLDFFSSLLEAGSVTLYDLNADSARWSVKPFAAQLYGNNYPSINEITVSPDGKLIGVIASNSVVNSPHELKILNASNGATLRTFKLPSFHPQCSGRLNDDTIYLDPVTVRFAKDSRTMYVLFRNQYGHNFGACKIVEDRWVIALDAVSGQQRWKFQAITPPEPAAGIPANSCSLPFHSLALSPDGRRVALGDCVGTIAILDSATGSQQFRVPAYVLTARHFDFPGFYSIHSLVFDPTDSNHLFVVAGESASKTMIAQVSLTQRNFTSKLLTGVSDSMPRLAFSPDGRVLGIGGDNLYLMDRQTGRVLFLTWESNGYARRFAFHPRSQELALIMQQEVIFVQPRPRRSIFQAGAQWKSTGLRVERHTALFARATNGAEISIGWSGRRIDAYDYESIEHFGFDDDYYIKEGGELELKSTGGNIAVEIYGGMAGNESPRALRQSLLPWGRYWSNMGVLLEEEHTDVAEDADDSENEIETVDPEDAEDEFKYAINTSNTALLRGALAAGADVNTRMDLENTGLINAAITGDIPIMKILLEHGADVEARNFVGNSALTGAAYNGELEAIRELLRAGADVNGTGYQKITPLMNAARKCRVETVRVLIEAGAANSARDEEGQTAHDYALTNCDYSLTRRMEAVGLKPQ
ncbi:MAG: ankyrin repeat domain-containing protein [Leptospiraceae bacterium]|nr:ankyrin repeat domain-containing protein [Leptospiraceae bacterium]